MSKDSQSFDVVVLGGGPGGYVAAIRAAQLGLRTACIEKERLGGICLNWGCIPSKALLHSASLFRQMQDAKRLGFHVDGLRADWGKVVERSRNVAARLEKGVHSLFKKYGVVSISGEGTLDRPGKVRVGDDLVSATHVIVATGARPRELPGMPFDGRRVLTYKEAMVLAERPERLLVVGAGAIGAEFAWFFNAFGTKVTLVEMASRIVPAEDDEVSEALAASFRKQGIDVRSGSIARDVEITDTGVRAVLGPARPGEGGGEGGGESIEVDRALVAVGVQGNVEGLGLEACGVEIVRGAIRVDRDLRTTCPGIYAVGDCAGPPWLAHKASAEGIHCVERIAGHPGKPVDAGNIPACTYCEPQVASVGLTEAAARSKGREVRVGRFPFAASGKAIAVDASDGFVKVVLDRRSGEILGCHMIGHGVTDLIGELTLARTVEATEAEVLATIHAHPTLSEAIHEAVGQAMGESVNY